MVSPKPSANEELSVLVKASKVLPDRTPAYVRRLLAEREFTLRYLLDQPPLLDPRDDQAAEAMGNGNFRRRRLPTADQQA